MTLQPHNIPPRAGETQEDAAFREAINALSDRLMKLIDGTVDLKASPNHLKRQRHVARGKLLDFNLAAMHCRDLSKQKELTE